MQPNQNAAGTPNRNVAGAAGGVGASPAGAGVAGGAAPRPGMAGGSALPRPGMAGAASQAVAGGLSTPATQRAMGASTAAPANAAAPVDKKENAPKQNIMAAGISEKKKSKGMVLGLILLALLAAGGIGFGVWAMMDGNSQVAKKDATIKDLKQQNSDLLEQLDNASATTDDPGAYKNPVIRSDNAEVAYSLGFQSSYILGQNGTRRVSISVKDGQIEKCSLMEQVDANSWNEIGECTISGIEGNIFKVIEFGQGQENSGNMIGFIMEDGRVAYFKLYDFESSNSVNIAGYLNIDGYVTDALEIGVGNGTAGGYGSTVFIKNDGSYIVFNESMMQ